MNFKSKQSKIIIILLFVLIVFAFTFVFLKKTKKQSVVKTVKIVDDIKGYELKETATTYYKNLFNELKVELSKKEVNEENYAKLISQLFLSDLFTLKNKINQNDVGGVQFVYKPYQDDLIKLAKDTLYSHVENNVYGDRKQELPVVSGINIVSVESTKFEYNDKIDKDAYLIKTLINYEKDLGYQTESILVIIHNGERLEIAEMK